MFSNFVNYKVKIRPDSYKTKKGLVFETTASISFLDDNKKELAYFDLAYLDVEVIYKKIDQGEAIIFDECYIENFSLSEYRKSRGIDDDTIVTLTDFSAKGTFFDAKIETDFSFAKFLGDDISFEETRFINGSVSFQKAQFPLGNKNFTNIIFKNGEVDFSNANFIGGKVDFKNSIFFDGIKNFQYTNFGEGSVSFINTEFGKGEVNFINTNFGKGDVSFKVARFNAGKIDFQFAQFGEGDISFERTEFGDGKVDFRKVEFAQGKVNFNRSLFGAGDVTFEASELKESRMTFKKTDFGDGNLFFEEVEYSTSEVLFENALFGKGNVYFGKSLFKKLSLISCHLNQYFDFRVAHCEYLDLSDTIARDIVDFSPYDYKVGIDCLNLSGMRLIGQIYIDWYENNVQEIIQRQEDTGHAEKAEQFRILKENYGRIGNYKFEDLAYIQFKRNEQKAELNIALKKSKLNALWQLPLYGFKLVVIDRMGLYATSPARVISSLIIVYFTFSMIYVLFPFFLDTSITCIDVESGFFSKMFNTFYYSMITFATVGYGECVPVGILRLVAALEGFVGPFMMSYFTVAFARKILR